MIRQSEVESRCTLAVPSPFKNRIQTTPRLSPPSSENAPSDDSTVEHLGLIRRASDRTSQQMADTGEEGAGGVGPMSNMFYGVRHWLCAWGLRKDARIRGETGAFSEVE